MPKLSPFAQEHCLFLLKRFKLQPIIDALHQVGGHCYVVGGTARDLLTASPTRDVDIEVYGLSQAQLEVILRRFEPVELVGKSFGVFKLRHGMVDFSLPRTDNTPGRHPEITTDPFLPLEKALIRRDLTINAMAYDLQIYQFIDPFNGQRDLEKNVLRSPDLNFFAQDPLRFWRVFQFVGRFAAEVDAVLTTLCGSMGLEGLADERIVEELHKWALLSTTPAKAVQWLYATGQQSLLGFQEITISPALVASLNRSSQLVYASALEKIAIRFALLVATQPQDQQRKSLKQLTHATKMHKAVTLLIDYSMTVPSLAEIKFRAPALCKNGLNAYTLLQFLWCNGQITDSQKNDYLHALIEQGILLSYEQPLVRASDIQSWGLEDRLLGQFLAKAYRLQILEGIKDKSSLIALMKKSS